MPAVILGTAISIRLLIYSLNSDISKSKEVQKLCAPIACLPFVSSAQGGAAVLTYFQ